jgi:hypothetical protein
MLQPVCLGIKHPSGAYYQIFVTVRQLRVSRCRALSLTKGRVCRLQVLVVLARAVIVGSESHGTRNHILLPQIRDFPFCHLLRLAGLRWKYSTRPPHGLFGFTTEIFIQSQGGIIENTSVAQQWIYTNYIGNTSSSTVVFRGR